jgi:hypothetical protein
MGYNSIFACLPMKKIPTIRLFLPNQLLPVVIAITLFLFIFALKTHAKTVGQADIVVISQTAVENQQAAEVPTVAAAVEIPSQRPLLFTLLDKEKENMEKGYKVKEEEGCRISDTFTAEVKNWEGDICRWSEEHSMDPDLIATIMQIESCGNNNAKSVTGVRGLFQVTGANLDGEEPWDPNISMAKGPGKVLKNELAAANGDIKAALAGYNGGGFAREYVEGKISRTAFYRSLRNHRSGYWRTSSKALAKINEVEWYAEWANIYFEAKNGDKTTINKWLEKGGHRMCPSVSL